MELLRCVASRCECVRPGSSCKKKRMQWNYLWIFKIVYCVIPSQEYFKKYFKMVPWSGIDWENFIEWPTSVIFSLHVSLTSFQKYSQQHVAHFCFSWDSLQEIDSSWKLFFQRAATIWGRYTLSFVRCVCESSHALTYRIWVGWREDSLLNKWPLSCRRRQPLMSLSSQLARSTSSPWWKNKKIGLQICSVSKFSHY